MPDSTPVADLIEKVAIPLEVLCASDSANPIPDISDQLREMLRGALDHVRSMVARDADAHAMEVVRLKARISALKSDLAERTEDMGSELVAIRVMVGLPDGTDDDHLTVDLVKARIAELEAERDEMADCLEQLVVEIPPEKEEFIRHVRSLIAKAKEE